MLDPFDCYELCVQSPRHVVAFLRAVHRGEPTTLHEDFCGTAAISRRWAAEARKRGDDARALGTDLDALALSRAKQRAEHDDLADRIRLIRGDLRTPIAELDAEAADLVFVGNFSIGYLHTREELLKYLRGVLGRLRRGNAGFGGGIFACDLYGGAGAFRLGGLERRHPGRGREVVRYCWTHEAADPISGMVVNSISFRVELDGEIVAEHPRAFEYRWRLWSLAELGEAMSEVGFSELSVYKDINVAPGQSPSAVRIPAELGEDWIVVVIGRA